MIKESRHPSIGRDLLYGSWPRPDVASPAAPRLSHWHVTVPLIALTAIMGMVFGFVAAAVL